MSWINQDWEKEAERDTIYALEKQLLTEQEFFEHENVKKKPAKITYKLNGNKNNGSSLSRVNKKGPQPRHYISAEISRKRNKH